MAIPAFLKSRVLATASVAALAASAGAVLVGPSPAFASCSSTEHRMIDLDPRTDVVFGAFDGLALRSGPHTSCTKLYTIPDLATVNLGCYDLGDNISGDDSWSFVTYAGKKGWVSNFYLYGSGADYYCN
jgi:hypothetical protein